MASRVFDYFLKSDPFEFNFRLLMLNGFWPIKTKSKCLQALYSTYSYLCCFSPISMLFIQIMDVYLLLDDPFTLTKNVCATSITLGSVVKYLFVFYKVNEIEALHTKLLLFKRSRSDPEDLQILENSRKFMSRSTRSLYGLAIPCIIAWMLYPGLESSKEYGLPFPYRLPTDDWSTPIYEILYTYQSLSMVGFMVMLLSVDLIYYGTVIEIISQYDILIVKINQIKTILNEDLNSGVVRTTRDGQFSQVTTQRVKQTLRECVAFHQQVLEEIDQLRTIFGMPYLVHFLCAVTLVAVIIIDVTVISKGFKLQMLQRVMYTANGAFDTFLVCLFTTLLEEKSYKLRRAIYASEWYNLGSDIRRDMLMIIMRTKKAPTCKMGYHFTLNLEAFLQFLKLSYNMAALLYQTVGR